MKTIKFIATGIVFGIILTKSEMISWYRWQEMFRFESFHLFGIMLSAVITGAAGIAAIKKFRIRDISGKAIIIPDKARSFYRYAIGGFIFGAGWALAGCPGAHFALIGHGYVMILPALFSAVMGTWLYGAIHSKLPH